MKAPPESRRCMITCHNRKVSWRRAPEDVGWALGVDPAESVCAIRCHWSVNSEPAAISTTYLTRAAARSVSQSQDEADAQVAGLLGLDRAVSDGSGRTPAAPLGRPATLHLEIQPPPSSVARSLRLTAGQPAIAVTIRFDESVPGSPVALMVTAMRPDLFRIVVLSAADGDAGPGDAADRQARAGRCG
ncbi:MAG: GntR family transcriptional regulator [Streptosporangiaceae bacterium]